MQTKVGAPKPRLSLSDPRVRAWLFQIITVALVVFMGWYLFNNTQTNLQHRGITSGFDFLERSAGFGIAQHLIDYTESDSYARVFVIGLLNTLLVSVIGVILATILGFIIGIARLSPNWMINKLATVYVEVFRNIPPLLQILFWYFAVFLTMPGPRNSHNFADTFYMSSRGLNMPAAIGTDGFWPFVVSVLLAIVAVVLMARWANKRFEATGVPFHKFWAGLGLLLVIPGLCMLIFGSPVHWEMPQLKGFNFVGGWVLIPELLALTIALTVYTAAFIAEIVRSGIKSVSHGQTEAARSLGLNASQSMRHVVLPQAFKRVLPPLAGQFISLVKDTSLVSVIAITELLKSGREVITTSFSPFEILFCVAGLYLLINLPLSHFASRLERRLAQSD